MGKKIPEGWSCLCYCDSSWKCRSGGGEEPQPWVFLWAQWPAHLAGGCLGLLQPRLLMLSSPQAGLCTAVLYRNFVDYLPLHKDGLVIYCTVLDSMAPAKNQPLWKAAKKFQQCESRNKLGACITIAAIARISPTIFPPMFELFSTHAMRHRKAVHPPWAWPAGCTPSLFPACDLIPGESLLAVSEVLSSNYDHCENFSSPWILWSLYSVFNISSCLQLLLYWVQLQSRPSRNQWAIKHTSHDTNWYVLPAHRKDYCKQEKIWIPKMSMMMS